jgi:hypothetical protein
MTGYVFQRCTLDFMVRFLMLLYAKCNRGDLKKRSPHIPLPHFNKISMTLTTSNIVNRFANGNKKR